MCQIKLEINQSKSVCLGFTLRG